MPLANLYSTKVSGAFYGGYAQAMADSYLNALTIRESLPGETVKFSWGSRVGKPKEWAGHRQAVRPIARAITVTNKTYELTSEIPLRDFQRDETGSLNRHIGDLSKRMADFPWDEMCRLIKNGATSGNNSYDGQTFFDTDHSIGASGTQKNVLTSSEVATLDVTTANAPTPEEAAVALLDTIGYMHGWLDEAGDPLLQSHKDFLVICNYNLYGAMQTAVSANNLASGKTNALINSTGLNIGVKAEPRCYSNPGTASAVFYIAAVNHPSLRPFLLNEETPVQLEVLDAGSEFAYHTDHISAGVKWRGGTGYGEPLTIAKCTLS